jgi:hypothetical protein
MSKPGRDQATLRYVVRSLRHEAGPLSKHSDHGLQSQGYALKEAARRFGRLLEPKPKRSRGK